VVSYDRNARSLDELSICQTQPLNALGASAIKSRSFQSRYPSGDRPFPRSSLDDEPDSYAVALQFSDSVAAANQPLFEALRAWRADRAREQGMPAYIVFGDATLRALAEQRPATLADLDGISGIGAKKREAYGEAVLAVVAASA